MQPLHKAEIIQILRVEFPYLRRHFGVERIALFGSYARGTNRPNSDIDLVVALSKPLGFSFIELADHLEQKLGGKIDLVTATSLELNIADPRKGHIARNIQESLIYV